MPASSEINRAVGPVTPPAPEQPLFKWAMENPEAVRRIVALVNQLSNLEIVLVVNGVTTRCPLQIPPGGTNCLVEIVINVPTS